MKVIVVNDASEARGGATGLALLQAKMLAARGIETVFAAADQGGNTALEEQGVRCYSAGSAPLMKLPAHKAAIRGLYNADVRKMLERVIAAHPIFVCRKRDIILTSAVDLAARNPAVFARCFRIFDVELRVVHDELQRHLRRDRGHVQVVRAGVL